MPIIVKCSTCGKNTKKYLSRIKRYKSLFCSRECFFEHNRGLTGEKSGVWKGDSAEYSSKHQVIASQKGRPKHCTICGTEDPSKKYEWANKDHKYSRNLKDYFRACVKCHRKYDIEHNGYKKNRKGVSL